MQTGGEQARSIDHWRAASIVAGAMVGVGIFINPDDVMGGVGGAGTAMLMWLFGGLAALCGAFCMAELATLMPRAGGEVVYLEAAYGKPFSFASGWLAILAVMTGSIATLAVATVTFQGPALLGMPLSQGEITAIAIGLVLVFTAINHLGAKVSGTAQLLTTVLPMLLLLGGSLYGLAVNGGASRLSDELAAPGAFSWPSLAPLAAAYLPVYWTYAGWNAATYVAGEIREPRRGLPRALLLGTGAVTVLYLVANAGFIAVLGSQGVKNGYEAGSATAAVLFGPEARVAVAALIAVAIMSSINGTMLGGSRIIFAMAGSGMFPRVGARLDPRFKTPTVALWLQAAWTSGLILSAWLVHKNSVQVLLDYTATAMLITGSLAVGAVIVLRRRGTANASSYRTFAYPVTPFVYLVSSLGVLTVLLYQGKTAAWAGVGILAGALLAGWLWTRATRI